MHTLEKWLLRTQDLILHVRQNCVYIQQMFLLAHIGLCVVIYFQFPKEFRKIFLAHPLRVRAHARVCMRQRRKKPSERKRSCKSCGRKPHFPFAAITANALNLRWKNHKRFIAARAAPDIFSISFPDQPKFPSSVPSISAILAERDRKVKAGENLHDCAFP